MERRQVPASKKRSAPHRACSRPARRQTRRGKSPANRLGERVSCDCGIYSTRLFVKPTLRSRHVARHRQQVAKSAAGIFLFPQSEQTLNLKHPYLRRKGIEAN